MAAKQNGDRFRRSHHVLFACGPYDLFLLDWVRQRAHPNRPVHARTEIHCEALDLPRLIGVQGAFCASRPEPFRLPFAGSKDTRTGHAGSMHFTI
jgi:hypothetical protein